MIRAGAILRPASLLWLLGLAFAVSVALRLPDLAGAARADTAAEAAGGPGTDPLEEVLNRLSAREDRVARREAAVESRIAVLQDTERRVSRQISVLADAEARLTGHIEAIEAAQSEDLEQLTTVYEQMKPKEAAGLFERMTPEFAAGFLGRMRGEAAAAIMAGLTSEKAYAISVILAGRYAYPPAAPASGPAGPAEVGDE